MKKRQPVLFFVFSGVAVLVGLLICSGYFNQPMVKTNAAERICSTQHCCKMRCPQKKSIEIKTIASPVKESPSFDVFPFGLPRLSFSTFIIFTDVLVVKASVPLT